ncbi:MAG: winged helix-turn-helix domain-containing protein [Candidatus Eremiobacteraeota bacterium]|nr:winged helix-turn-helix domain-containing protein [Candidatus Eremiobacteraeota bacterium]
MPLKARKKLKNVFIHRLKLRAPQELTSWIARPLLERRVLGDSRVVSIVAGPGYGKTTLAARASRAWNGATLWYGMDETDADLPVFGAHVDAALRGCGLKLRALDFDNAASLGTPAELGRLFAEALSDAPKPLLLIFDEVDALESSRAGAALTELVERGWRTGARFILCGRSMPLSLHRVAAAAQLQSIGAGDLAFDDGESRVYLQGTLGKATPGGAVEQLVKRAEGWPAGLALIASGAVTGSEKATPQGFAGGGDDARRYLFDYLASEVLSSLSDDEQRFLLETSILDRLETNLCNALTQRQNSGAMLDSLTTRGLFLSKSAPDAYSCHQLFAEFLTQTLARSNQPQAVASLHRRAALYFASAGDWLPATRHYLDAGDIEAAASILEREAFVLLRAGLFSAVGHLLMRIGDQRIDRSPALSVAQGRIRRERGDWDAALGSLERAMTLARGTGQYDAIAEAVRTAAPILGSRNEFDRLQTMLHEALALEAHLQPASTNSLRMTLAAVHLESDRLDDAVAMYRDITPSLVAQGDLGAQALVMHNLGVAQLRRGDVYAGLSTYERAMQLKEKAGQRASLLHTLGDIVYAKTLLGHYEEADRLAESLLAQASDMGATDVVARAHELRGVLALLRDNASAAADEYRAGQQACDPGDILVLPDIEHGLAQCALRTGDLSAAEFHSARASASFQGAGRPQQRAPVLLTQAACALARSDPAAAGQLAGKAARNAARGKNALLEATSLLGAADVLARCAAGDAALDDQAAAAAAQAVALIHQRDYRFLLRTQAELFERLKPHLQRWRIGTGLIGESGPEQPQRPLRVEMIGALRVLLAGRPVPPEAWKRRKAPELFAFLVAAKGKPISRARLIDLYWPESDADAAHDSLRVTVSAIRKAVGDIVRYEANGYRFAAPAEAVIDVELFDAHTEQARQADVRGDREAAARFYSLAAELYRGDYLEDIADAGWLWRERERLRADCLEALRWLAADRLRTGDRAGQRHLLDRLLEVAPFDLDAVRMRLAALIAENRQSDARKDYAVWRSGYRQAVGMDAPDVWPQAPALLLRRPKGGQAKHAVSTAPAKTGDSVDRTRYQAT